MVQEKTDIILPPSQQNRPALSWEMKIKKKLKTVPSCLGIFRPTVGQCCHKCTPDSLRKKLGPSHFLGFHDLLNVSETNTRFRGWLVRRVCFVLFVSGRKVYASPASNRLERVCQSNRLQEELAAGHEASEGGDGRGKLHRLSPFLPLINTCISSSLLRFLGWAMLKIFVSAFDSIHVNLNHLSALHRASEESIMDCALISLVLFCHSLRVPYTLCPLQINSSLLRWVLQKVGVIIMPSTLTKHNAEMDSVYSSVMTSLMSELLHEGQAISAGVSVRSGQGGEWLAHVRQLIREGSIPDVSLVPVGISYDCIPKTNMQDPSQVGSCSVLLWLLSHLWRRPGGCIRIHFAQPFSLKEMSESGRCRVDEWLPLQDLLLPVILNNRSDSVFGQRKMSWLLPTSHYPPELIREGDLTIAIILHLIFSAYSCMAVMSTSLVSSLLLYKHRKGVSASVLCRDVAWLTEELLFRNKDVGFGGTLAEVIHYSLSLLAPHLIIAALPSRKDPFIAPRPSLAATHHLSFQAQIVTHTFILEAVGACAVSAMLCDLAASGISSRVRPDGVDGEGVKGDMDFDVVLSHSQLAEKALQLYHLLPPGLVPPCQSSQSCAEEAVDSLVRCGILIMEEIPKDVPVCDFWKKDGALTWFSSDDPQDSDSDCEEQGLHSYRISQPSQCPDMLVFLCRMLAGHLRTLCWTVTRLDHIHTPLPDAEFVAQIHSHLCDRANETERHYESCSEEAAHTAVRTLIDLGVLSEERREGGVFLGVSPLFQLPENRHKLHCFISQYLN